MLHMQPVLSVGTMPGAQFFSPDLPLRPLGCPRVAAHSQWVCTVRARVQLASVHSQHTQVWLY